MSRTPRHRQVVMAGVVLALLASSACGPINLNEPTPVPGAAATAARLDRTPIPTPVRTPTVPSVAQPSPAIKPPPSPSPSPLPEIPPITDAEVARVQRELSPVLRGASLPGVEAWLGPQISISSAAGGLVLNPDEAARWLRDRAGPDVRLTEVIPARLAVLLQVETEGWPATPESPLGRVTFNLYRLDARGEQDPMRGDWKISIIAVE